MLWSAATPADTQTPADAASATVGPHQVQAAAGHLQQLRRPQQHRMQLRPVALQHTAMLPGMTSVSNCKPDLCRLPAALQGHRLIQEA